MGKKSKFKKNKFFKKDNAPFDFQFTDKRDPLHEGRSFVKRRYGMWDTFNMANKICHENEKSEQLGILGENV